MKMASVARTLQSVRPHVPMIKFPLRREAGSTDAVTSMVQSTLPTSQPGQSSSRSPVSSSSSETVPLKYRRKPISIEEMEFIERGGPE